MKRFIVIFLLLFFSLSTFATHNRAGEITYRQIGPLTYEVTITTYTKNDAPADRCELTINWGDGTSKVLYRTNGPSGGDKCSHMGELVENNIKKNIYTGTHTYSTASIYTLYMLDPNRNEGVLNINNSVDEPFYIQSTIMIGTGLGYNNSPVLLNPPTDFGCINTPYIHNVSAYDSDGDSLTYKMVNCRGANGREIETTYTPSYNLDKVIVDSQGTIYWDAPQFAGIYNIAIEITEHRKDIRSGEWIAIGRILRDIQVDVTACTNNPPTISSPDKFCVIGGDILNFTVTANDADGDKITLTAVGGPLEISPTATFPKLIEQVSPVSGDFNWVTDCSLARRATYSVTFKANDFPFDQHGNRIPGLSTQKIVEIRIVAPPVENLTVTENISNANFDISWENNECGSAIGYVIYRKEHSGDYNSYTCEGGLPDDSGYKPIAIIDDPTITTFRDNNNDIPLKIGVKYCYVVTSILFDKSESMASDFACATLKKRLPVLTNIDIEKTSYSVGEVNIIWSKPSEIDATIYPGPYAYKLLRAEGINGNNFIEISDNFNSINDTTYFDSGIDTYSNGYNYRVDFYNKPDNTSWSNASLIGISVPASSPYLKVKTGDKKLQLKIDEEVAWKIDSIIYYQEIDESLIFKRIGKLTSEDIIGKTDGEYFIVDNLENGKEYCFRADVYGSYDTGGFTNPLFNRSQIACGTPNINTLQCPPVLSFDKNCNYNTYELHWTNPNLICDEEIIGYNLYVKEDISEDIKFVTYVNGENNTFYDLLANDANIGCYYVTGVDVLGNETIPSNIECYVPCLDFILPNVFTPNGDGKNETYHPKWKSEPDIPEFLFKVISFDIEIFNRWGNLMYKTDDIKINWDGTNQMTGKACATGVYYYVCTIVKEVGDQAPEKITLTGYIHLFK